MADIRIKDLPLATGGTAPVPSDVVAIDGATTRKSTIQVIVDTGAPVASQATAEAGTNNNDRMTALSTAQAIEARAVVPSDVGTTVQPYSASLATLSGVTPGSAGVSMLALSLGADVRSFLTVAPYVTSRTNLKTLDTTKDKVAILTEDGREGIFKWATGDFSTQITTDTLEGVYVKANAIASSAGAWVRFNDGQYNALWFGAVKATQAQVASTSLYNAVADSSPAFAAAHALAALIGGNVIVPSGVYKATQTFDVPSGVVSYGLGTNEAFEIPFFDLNSMTLDRGTTIIMTGNGTRDKTIDFVSAMRHSGGSRTNPIRTYNNTNDQYLEAWDGTNGNASGTTKATLKPFSLAMRTGNDGLSGKTGCLNIRFVPRCDDGTNGPLSGYLAANANNYVPWDEWDVPGMNLTGYTSIIEDCQFAGYWNTGGFLQTSIRFGNTTAGGRGEMAIYQRNWFQNGVMIRNGDFYPVLSKTGTSVTIAWSPGHRFDLSGSIFIDSKSYAYTGLTYSATGDGSLTFTGIASTTDVVVSGDDRSVVHMTNNNGTTQTVFRDNNIRDFWHSSLVERPSTVFGAQAGKYNPTIQIVGYPERGITWGNNTIYSQNPIFLLQLGARNIFWKEGTHEAKPYRAALGGALNPSGDPMSLALVGPSSAYTSTWPMLFRGDATTYGFPWSGANIAPVGIAPSGQRYSSYTDCFNGYRYCAIGEPTTDQPIIWDARLPKTYVPTGTSDVDASLTVYDEVCLVNHSGSPNPLILVTLKAPWYIKRVVLKQLNATNDLELKQGTAAEQFSLGGNNLRLFSSLQNIVLVRNNAQSAWTIEGNYGTNGTFANVTTTGGIVTGGT